METQDFEEIKVVKFQWLLRDFCCDLPPLKKASKYVAIHGIILCILILVLGAAGNFLLAGSVENRDHVVDRYLTIGFIFLAIGAFLLIYNLILLNRVKANRGVGVFRTIKAPST